MFLIERNQLIETSK